MDVSDRKIVYHAGSELYTATHQLNFMPDPNDTTFTVVRFMSHVELSEWRKALSPVVKGVRGHLPWPGVLFVCHVGAHVAHLLDTPHLPCCRN